MIRLKFSRLLTLIIAGLCNLFVIGSYYAYALTLSAPTTIVDPNPWPATNSTEPDRFGTYVTSISDIDGDGVPDIAVGVPFQDAGQQIPGGFGLPENEGQVFLFSGATRTFIRTLSAPDFQALSPPPKWGGKFGSTVVSMGDVDGDGVADLAVTAPMRSISGSFDGAGKVYIFSGKTGNQIRTISDASPSELG